MSLEQPREDRPHLREPLAPRPRDEHPVPGGYGVLDARQPDHGVRHQGNARHPAGAPLQLEDLARLHADPGRARSPSWSTARSRWARPWSCAAGASRRSRPTTPCPRWATRWRTRGAPSSSAATPRRTTRCGKWSTRRQNLKYLIIETAFSNKERDIAIASKHLCPRMLAEELDKMHARPEVFITHLKPGGGRAHDEGSGRGRRALAPAHAREQPGIFTVADEHSRCNHERSPRYQDPVRRQRRGHEREARVLEEAAGRHQPHPLHQQRRRDHPRRLARHLPALRGRPDDGLHHERGRILDRLEGEDGTELVQGHQAADLRVVARRLCGAQQAPHEHQGRLRRRGAQAVLGQPHVPQGGRPAHRLPLQADADRADPGRRLGHRADGRDPAHQQPRRPAVLVAARRGRGGARRRRSPSPSACASRCRARSSRSSSTW